MNGAGVLGAVWLSCTGQLPLTMRRAILSALFVYSTCVGAAEQPVVLENGRSPDGKYFMRIQPPGDLGAVMYLEVCTIAEATVVGKTNAGGYAHFSMMADEMNTTVLWSPDSTHFALMTRGTKRSTEVRLFQMTSTGMAEITLPSPTDRAMVLLKAAESNRCVFQRPL